VPPNQVTEWRRQPLERAADAFGGGAPVEPPVDLKVLHAKIGFNWVGITFDAIHPQGYCAIRCGTTSHSGHANRAACVCRPWRRSRGASATPRSGSRRSGTGRHFTAARTLARRKPLARHSCSTLQSVKPSLIPGPCIGSAVRMQAVNARSVPVGAGEAASRVGPSANSSADFSVLAAGFAASGAVPNAIASAVFFPTSRDGSSSGRADPQADMPALRARAEQCQASRISSCA